MSNEVHLTKEGDSVKIRYEKWQSDSIDVTDFDNVSMDSKNEHIKQTEVNIDKNDSTTKKIIIIRRSRKYKRLLIFLDVKRIFGCINKILK